MHQSPVFQGLEDPSRNSYSFVWIREYLLMLYVLIQGYHLGLENDLVKQISSKNFQIRQKISYVFESFINFISPTIENVNNFKYNTEEKLLISHKSFSKPKVILRTFQIRVKYC